MRKTKILATIGPATFKETVLNRIIREGVDVVRINFSHGTHEEKLNIIKMVRKIEKKVKRLIPIVGDLQGPVVRLGDINDLPVRRGNIVYLVPKKKGNADNKEIPIPNEDLYAMIEENDLVLIESGRIIIRADEIMDDKIKGTVLLDGVIKSEKTVAIKGKDIPLPTLSDKDIEDVKFCVENDVDFIGLSFVRSPRDVIGLRELLEDLGHSNTKIISKIETRQAVDHLRAIIKRSDAIMIARGDLAIYYDLEKIPKIQQYIVKESRAHGKPVILATQLLESMTENPMPTRSEVVDVVNAVKEGVDALMLAGETAVGKYPIESVSWLDKIIREAEKMHILPIEHKEEDLYDRFAQGIVQMADSLNAKIAAYTRSGTTAYRIARYRPQCDVYSFTPILKVARQLQILHGVKAFLFEDIEPNEAFPKIIDFLKHKKEILFGDIVILTAGMTVGTTDTIRIEKIGVK
ncbi:MAG: pyruvate kinase [Candidatus Asgardarchaeia archaeon]